MDARPGRAEVPDVAGAGLRVLCCAVCTVHDARKWRSCCASAEELSWTVAAWSWQGGVLMLDAFPSSLLTAAALAA